MQSSNNSNKHILIFGAGKSATCLIEYMIAEAAVHGWTVTVADNNLALAQSKIGTATHAKAVSINVENEQERNAIVQSADIVISLLPPALHFLVAQDCVLFEKNLLTASYTDEKIRSLQPAIENKKLLFLCEMGLDPGIDHMSAMQLIHRIKSEGGHITSFLSHCGGLVAPESDDNPWHYKISWNPRNVVTAGKAGAVYRQKNETVEMPYEKLFDANRQINMPGLGQLAWYPNRDSLSYLPLYELEDINTFIRTTLRYPDFSDGWKKLIDAKLTSEEIQYETDGMSLRSFFELHFQKIGLSTQHFSPLFTQQLNFLGLQDENKLINKGNCSVMDILQFALEKKLVLHQHDKDMIVMLHEIEYQLNNQLHCVTSSLIVKGDDNLRTAMAKTVGLPLGIAAKLILQGKIKETGLHIPITPAIYEPVLRELQQHSIRFQENIEVI
ncbi:MAG: saccharopine dehydrogenase C-terminal domain-containing protein [Chitinophagaceae bacterium]